MCPMLMSMSMLSTRSPTRSATRAVRRSAASRHSPPRVPLVSSGRVQPTDYHFSHYSLADADGGVCIDMTDGRVSFNWAYVPIGSIPGAFATFVRRLHFRSGRHVDEPLRHIQVPSQPRTSCREC
jgi:hypothetical protein